VVLKPHVFNLTRQLVSKPPEFPILAATDLIVWLSGNCLQVADSARTTAVYYGQENICALAPSTRLCSCVRRGRIISRFYLRLAPNANPTGLSSSVFLVAIAR
jgi:hypothetical protein